MTTIDVYFDVGSPASYLAWTQLPGLAQQYQADICWKPMLLGGVFKATGNASPAMLPAKGRYMTQDLARYAQAYGVALSFPPNFPINTLALMRGAAAYLDTPQFDAYVQAVFTALWVEQQDLSQPAVVAEVLTRAGFDPAEVLARSESPEVKERLKQITAEAVERGVFGAPTCFVNGEMFFGQDRLQWVAQALQDGQS